MGLKEQGDAVSVDLDNPGEHWEWAAVIEAKTQENAKLRQRVLETDARVDGLRAYANGILDIHMGDAEVRWRRAAAAESIARRALVAGLAECARLRDALDNCIWHCERPGDDPRRMMWQAVVNGDAAEEVTP